MALQIRKSGSCFLVWLNQIHLYSDPDPNITKFQHLGHTQTFAVSSTSTTSSSSSLLSSVVLLVAASAFRLAAVSFFSCWPLFHTEYLHNVIQSYRLVGHFLGTGGKKNIIKSATKLRITVQYR